MKPIKLFTDSDLDGVSCGIIAETVFYNVKKYHKPKTAIIQTPVDITYSNPKNIDSDLQKFIDSEEYLNYSKIYITDLVIGEQIASKIDKINNGGYLFTVLDHHRTSAIGLSKYRWVRASEYFGGHKTCGAELFWNYLLEIYEFDKDHIIYEFISAMNRYVEYVRLYDTWDWVNDKNHGVYAKNMNVLFHIYGLKLYIESMVNKLTDINIDKFINKTEELLIEMDNQRRTRYSSQKINNIKTIDFENYKLGIVFAEDNISELGNYICKKMPEIDIAVIINTDICVVSLRTAKDNIDLSTFAKRFGGGGHPKSAGFVFSTEIQSNLIENIFKTKS